MAEAVDGVDAGSQKERKRVIRSLIVGEHLSASDLKLCRHSIKILHGAVNETERSTNEAKMFLSHGLLQLVNKSSTGVTEFITFWFQLLHRSLDVWNIQLKSRARGKFRIANGQLFAKTQELESVMNKVMAIFLKQQQNLQLLDNAMQMYPEVKEVRQLIPSSSPVGPAPTEDPPCQKSPAKEKLRIEFHGTSMEFLIECEGKTQQKIGLQDLPTVTQADVICIPILEQIRIADKIIWNITAATEILDTLNIVDWWEILIPLTKIKNPVFTMLETVVIAVLMNKANDSVYSLLPVLLELEGNIGHFSAFTQFLQIHAAGKKLTSTLKEFEPHDEERLKALHERLDHIPNTYLINKKQMVRHYSELLSQYG